MKRTAAALWILFAVLASALVATGAFFSRYPRPYRNAVASCGVPPALVYAVAKAESGFCEDAVSGKGAVGLMQLKPATAEFICAREGISFEREKLTEGEYNLRLGGAYLLYLLQKFRAEETAVAAYNAGEGTVSRWLNDGAFSADGQTLSRIPYPETQRYLEKVMKFKKIYEFLYR